MTDDQIIDEAMNIAQRRVDAQHEADLDLIEAGATEARRLLARLERSRDEQPEKLAAMREQAATERDWARIHEPWSSTLTGIPSYKSDGETAELHGFMSFPSIAAKEIWGCRLAFDVASSERQANEIVTEYFADIREPDHLMLVLAAAIDTLADHILKPMLDVVEVQAGEYEMRVRLADAARNAWATRIGETDK